MKKNTSIYNAETPLIIARPVNSTSSMPERQP